MCLPGLFQTVRGTYERKHSLTLEGLVIMAATYTPFSWLLGILFALLGTAALGSAFGETPLLLLLLFAVLAVISGLAFARLTLRRLCCAAPLALLLAVFLILGLYIDRTDNIVLSLSNLLRLSAQILGAGAALFPLSVLWLWAWDRMLDASGWTKVSVWLGRHPAVVFFACWALFFLSFVPALLAYWPGIFAYDFTTQINQAASGQITTHHPILHTLLCFFLLNIGKVGSDCTVGALCCSLVQMACLSGSFAYTISFLAKRKVPLRFLSLAFFFFLLLPIHGLFAINATKDILFSAAFLVLFVLTADLFLQPDRFFSSPWRWCRYTLFAVLACLLRNTGIYMLVVFFPFVLLFLRSHRVQALLLAVLCVCAVLGSSLGLQQATDAGPGSAVEALALPIQQMARSYQEHPDRFTPEEKQALFSLIPEESLNQYTSRLADSVKGDLSFDKQDAVRFLLLWLQKLPACFGSYVNAFLSSTEGFWYPAMDYPDARTYHTYIETFIKDINDDYQIFRQCRWQSAYSFYESIAAGEGMEEWPVLSLLFHPGTYAWVLFGLLALAVYRKNRAFGGVLFLLLISWGLLLLSPIALLRYAYPLMLAIPPALGLAYLGEKPTSPSADMK